jgi:SAM-dependent methyltransferase
MIPEGAGADTLWAHLYRYRFANRYVRGRDVLDVACGEGYGAAAMLRAGARSVVGVDIDPTICEYARRKYGVDTRPGDAASLPIGDASVDVVVSFETIEHVPDTGRFLDECSRVLRPGGRLVISTPNVDVYNPTRDPEHNPFHCSEMTVTEFVEAISGRFHAHRLYTQRPVSARSWSVRSLAVVRSPWRYARGFWRLWKKCRVFDQTAEGEARRDPVGEIIRSESWLSRSVNPYLVRSPSRWAKEVCTYIVCVADKPLHENVLPGRVGENHGR